MVNGADFATLIAMVNGREIDLDYYPKLQDAIIERLSKTEEVKKNITAECDLEAYERFLFNYERELIVKDMDEIRDYLTEIKESINIREQILDYRCSFMLEEYNDLPIAEKLRVVSKVNNDQKCKGKYEIKAKTKKEEEKDDIKSFLMSKSSNTEVLNEKQAIAENIKKVLSDIGIGGGGKGENRDSIFFAYALALSVMFVLVSALLFISVPIVCATLLEAPVLPRIIGFIEIYHIIALVYVGLLCFIGYYVRWKKPLRERLLSIRGAFKSTILYGILPILLYVAAYLLTYIVL